MITIQGGRVYQLGVALFLGRIFGLNGALLQQADVSTIGANCYDLGSYTPSPLFGPSQVNGRNLSVASVMFNGLQLNSSWTADTLGYNFADTAPSTSFPFAQHRYRMEYQFTLTAGGAFFVAFEVTTERTFTNG